MLNEQQRLSPLHRKLTIVRKQTKKKKKLFLRKKKISGIVLRQSIKWQILLKQILKVNQRTPPPPHKKKVNTI